MTDATGVSYCWCDAVASQLERPWKTALNRNYNIGAVCCGGAERVAAEGTNCAG